MRPQNDFKKELREAGTGASESPVVKPSPSSNRGFLWLLLLAVVCLVPFLNKAFHIDDTLFLRAAQQIQRHPLDFYGFKINWFGYTTPMTEAFDNPPLTCYYLALAAWIGGWHEVALHLAFLLPALAAVWGIYALAKRHCENPLLAGLVAVVTPVFLISATNVMCDVMLLAWWVWSLELFERGLEKRSGLTFALCGVLAGLAVLTKFTGLALIPLMGVYGFVRQKGPGTWLMAPVIPLFFAVAYDQVTQEIYGQGLLFAAANYASSNGGSIGNSHLTRGILGLIFLGGCCLPVLFYTPLMWPRPVLVRGLCLVLPCALLLPFAVKLNPPLWRSDHSFVWGLYVQSAVYIAGGIQVLLLTIMDFRSRRDDNALFLCLWVLGIFAFASVVNWTVNGRSLLPAVPAVGILLARGVTRSRGDARPGSCGGWCWPAIPACVIALLCVRADCALANSARTAARESYARYQRPGAQVWFEGHWGFQYYMEESGALPVDKKNPGVVPGDIIIYPGNNANVDDMFSDLLHLVEVREYKPDRYFTTLSPSVGAGFYSTIWGSLPFAAGRVEPEKYYAFEFAPLYAPGTRPADLPTTGALIVQKELEEQSLKNEAALRADPNNADAHLKLGVFLASRGRKAEALEHFRAVLRLKPDDGPAHFQAGALLEHEQRTVEAIAEYRAALRTMPDSVPALVNLAWILATHPDAKLRNGAEAVQLATRACELTQRKDGDSLAILAAAYAEAGHLDEAVATAREAIGAAQAMGWKHIAAANEKLLKWYQSHRPYHQEPEVGYPERW